MENTFDRVLGIPVDTTNEERYNIIINALGKEDVAACLLRPLSDLFQAYLRDRSLNSIPIDEWDKVAGFVRYGSEYRAEPSKLRYLIHKMGVTCYSPSELVCILKYCTREKIKEIYNVQ